MRKLLVVLSVVFLITAAMAQSSLPTGTPLKVKLETTISTFSSHVGDPFQGRLIDAVVIQRATPHQRKANDSSLPGECCPADRRTVHAERSVG